MERYGEEVRLRNNQLYTFSIRIHEEEKVVSFTSKYSPLFSSVRRIRNDYRDLFRDYQDDHINQIIHDNSLQAMEMSTEEISLDEDIPYAAKQYVRYRTELDLATDLFLTISSEAGSEDKQLADMRIMKQIQAPRLKDIMAVLEDKVDAWEIKLAGADSTVSSAVRAGANEYPHGGRVGF